MSDRVRAAVQTAPRTLDIREFDRPVIGPDDGLLRIEATGICGSDVEQYKGHLWRGSAVVPGHEPLGVIEEIGDRAATRWGVSVGDRVAVEIVVPCRSCGRCLSGGYLSCPHRRASHGYTPIDVAPSLWGGLAEYTYLAANSIVHRVAHDVPADVAVMFNPLGAGVRWTSDLGGVRLGSTVLILGSGQRGLASVIAAKAAGAELIIATGLATDEHKLALAREFGADHTIVADEQDTVAEVRALTGGEGVDVVLELTPMAAEPVSDAVQAARSGGRIVLAGLKGGTRLPMDTDLVINKALTVVGAYGVDAAAYEQAIRIIESGRFPLERLHTHTFALDDTATAVRTLAGEVEGRRAVHVSVHP